MYFRAVAHDKLFPKFLKGTVSVKLSRAQADNYGSVGNCSCCEVLVYDTCGLLGLIIKVKAYGSPD